MAVEILHMCMSGGVPMHNTGLRAIPRTYAAVLFAKRIWVEKIVKMIMSMPYFVRRAAGLTRNKFS